jgi:hypothetical protein
MRKMVLLTAFIILHVFCYSQSLAYKNKIALAILEHESYFGKYMYNKLDTASQGYFQMRHIYVSEVNRICGYKRFDDSDRFDYNKSVQMFFIFNNFHYPSWDYKTISIVHACGHYEENEKVLKYWDAIQQILSKFDK